MTTPGNEILLTELETNILSIFVLRKILDDKAIIKYLQRLIEKLQK